MTDIFAHAPIDPPPPDNPVPSKATSRKPPIELTPTPIPYNAKHVYGHNNPMPQGGNLTNVGFHTNPRPDEPSLDTIVPDGKVAPNTGPLAQIVDPPKDLPPGMEVIWLAERGDA